MSSGNEDSRVFRNLVLACQTLYGAWFLIHGLNTWVEFWPQPRGGSGPANEFLSILITTGLFTWIKAIEVVVGVLLLLHRLVPLAIVAGLPVTLSIVHFNLALHHDLFHTVTGVGVLVITTIVALGYMKNFRSLLAYDAGEPSSTALRAWLRRPFAG
jgi:hypothetical protein